VYSIFLWVFSYGSCELRHEEDPPKLKDKEISLECTYNGAGMNFFLAMDAGGTKTDYVLANETLRAGTCTDWDD
jgi:hypothetical protein